MAATFARLAKEWAKYGLSLTTTWKMMMSESEIKLIAYERDFKFVGVCTCGKRWNLPEQRVRKATIDDVVKWLGERDYKVEYMGSSSLPDWQKSSLAT